MHQKGPEEAARPPRKCPVCRVAMVAERSAPGHAVRAVFHCLNCGSVVAGVPLAVAATAAPDAAPPRRAGEAKAESRAVSAVDQFVVRQNIAIYERELAREPEPGRRTLLLDLLAEERAKQAPAGAPVRTRRP